MQKISAVILFSIYVTFMTLILYNCVVVFTYPKKYETYINYVCDKFEISKPMFYALVDTESSFNPNAKSTAGAIGLTQILPTTAQYICTKNNLEYSNFDLYNPSDNFYIGAMYLDYLFDKFNNSYTALCAYNAGETIVRSWLQDERYSYDKISLYNTPYKETNNYIKKIKKAEKIYIKFYKIK